MAVPTHPSILPPNYRPYAVSSPFNVTLPAKPRVHPESEAMIAALVDKQFPSRCRFYAGIGARKTSIGDYNHPLYRARPGDLPCRVQLEKHWGDPTLGGAVVHVPAIATPANAGDGHLAIFDGPEEFDFWQARIDRENRVIYASWGSRMPARGSGTELGAATAASFGLAAGIIRIAELEAALIRHALFLTPPSAPGVVPPAVKRNWKPAPPPALSLGTHLWLDMTPREIASIGARPWQAAILNAWARRGGLVGDTSGVNGTILGPESSQPWISAGLGDPLVEFAESQGIVGDRNGIYTFDFGGLVDWKSRLRVLLPSGA